MPIFALVDCNNFYASCERAFDPRLENKPVIVLSNNDGCVIARSNEAKKLDIPMGAPYFKIQALCNRHGIQVFSSNYELYGDMSNRVMQLLKECCTDREVYSIDEAFLQLDSYNLYDLHDFAMHMKTYIKQCTGIPVSIGIGPSKTLAKVANNIAKKQSGVFNVMDKNVCALALETFPVEKIWGVGRRITNRLKKYNIVTAATLRDSDPKQMRRVFSVVMEKTIAELNGVSCISLEEVPPAKKQIMSSRSFGKPVTSIQDLEEAVSAYAARACIKLRRQQYFATRLYVFIETNSFRPDKKQYANALSSALLYPTSDMRLIAAEAKKLLRKIYRVGFEYKKAGVMLLGLVSQEVCQYDLLNQAGKNSQKTMLLLDKINEKFGAKTLFLCGEGINPTWRMRRNKISKHYTTRVGQIPVVKCK